MTVKRTQPPQQPVSGQMAPIKHPKPNPRYRIHFDDISHAATAELLKIPALSTALEDAVDNVLTHLYEPYGTPQAVRSVTLILESMGGVAYTTGIPLDSLHKEIHISLEYISNFIKNPTRFREECMGVLTHEMVHCWQHDCCGTAPGGLVEGIADFVRLKAGLAPPHWKKTKDECGKRWDEGYQKTAWFLEWLEEKFGKGTVSRMNEQMDGKPYQESQFWKGLFNENVDTLWKQYMKHWDEPAPMTMLPKPFQA